jgi:hypothetical protein
MRQETESGTSISRAPWNDAEVASLNARQNDLTMHPYTCECGKKLYATHDGWICRQDRESRIKQTWAHRIDTEMHYG